MGRDKTVSTRSASPSALIIDEGFAGRRSLARRVAEAGFVTRAVDTAEKARCELADPDFDLALADLAVLDEEGRKLFDALSHGSMPVTGVYSDPGNGRSAGALQPGLSRLGRLIGSSVPMQHVYDQLLRVAPTTATVFLVGESGTGKELAAELIHGLSARASKPFAPVNGGALSPGLIESELFGHEKGSFTGADRCREGLFECAEGGTLLLDEITETPLDFQVKLLRFLESGKVRRVGGDRSIEVDVRVIAATNRDPEEAVAQGKLREDLLYRLMVFPIELPPLRRRAEDATLIAQHYLDRLNRGNGAQKRFTSGALQELREHRWPGNVRELRNAVERAFILADGEIPASCFFLEPFDRTGRQEEDLGVRVGMTIAEMERRLIVATLERLRGDKKKAAKTLGISLKTLYTRLSVYRAAARSEKARSLP